MGVVYEAWQEELGRSVALKLMTGASEEALLRFQREARTAASLGHPHIVQVFDFQIRPGEAPFIVMELVAGQSLRELVKTTGPVAEARAARLGVQVLSALDAAHAAGVLHRDIKPANLLLTTSTTLGEIAKVLDFGIAKVTTPDAPAITQFGDVIGTLAYMSPEQARGEALDGRCDVYSLAATLFFACTGQRALDAPSPEQMFRALVNGETRRMSSVRPGLDAGFCSIVERGLAAPREARFGSAGEMAAALSGWLDGQSGASRAHSSGTGPASMPLASAMQAAATASLRGPASMPGSGPASLALAAPTSMPGPMSGSTLGHVTAHSQQAPPPVKRGGSFALLGLGLAGVIGVGGVALVVAAGGGYYYYLQGDPSPASASAAPTTRAAEVSGEDVAPSAAGAPAEPTAAGTASKTRAAGGVSVGAKVVDAGAAPASAAPAESPPPPSATAPEPKAAAGAPGPVGAKCTTKAECFGAAYCGDGTCQCSYQTCGGFCFDLPRDAKNCGKCGNDCGAGRFCVVGSCTSCNTSQMSVCNGRCIMTTGDSSNCGACGVKCKPGKPCKMGVCAP